MPGQPQLNPAAIPPQFIGIDASNLVTRQSGTPTIFLRRGQATEVSLRFQLGGSAADWLSRIPGITFSIVYAFEGQGPIGEPRFVMAGNLVAGKLVYDHPETRATIPANTLQAGLYKLSGFVNFPGGLTLLAFFEGLLVEVSD
ncbi:hypothetical protein [Nonomuraea turcica]|uniref:hypothetical protein n=1 Tax=Nonomuraea sp. G32 TaxID=3067274 RepID=UPI00273C73DD|nr:hypothetical protein [Nonomuraea sp. G32]MDP4503222.1 hypothetical protein [Nonomuraea sp. G32]